ncbi:MAG: saccharopine dehydrogenase family protein [Candidatus Heimdallarchaeota archaeon]
MPTFAVLGLGLMGQAICHDLLMSDPEYNVIGFDRDKTTRTNAMNKFSSFKERFSTIELNLSAQDDPESHFLKNVFRSSEVAVAFGAIDYQFNPFLTKLSINAGCSFIDLGGNSNIVQAQRQLHRAAETARVTIIPDLGLAPGMVNIVAAGWMREFQTLHECHLRVGGLPQRPGNLLKYQKVFSIRGLTNEYLEDAVILRNGRMTTVPALTGEEHLSFPKPWGDLEAFHTGGGSGGLPKLYEGKIQHLTYKTIRYPGHFQYFILLKELGLLASQFPPDPTISPREVLEFGLEQYLPSNAPDAVLVQITITGIREGARQTRTYQLIDQMDPKTGYSAMARTTAFPTSIIGQYIAKGILNTPGVLYAEEAIPIEVFLNDLEQRQIKFEMIDSK